MRFPRTGRHPRRASAALQYVPRSLALCGDSCKASVNVFLLDVSPARTQQSSCLTQSISSPMGNGLTKYFTSCLLKKKRDRRIGRETGDEYEPIGQRRPQIFRL